MPAAFFFPVACRLILQSTTKKYLYIIPEVEITEFAEIIAFRYLPYQSKQIHIFVAKEFPGWSTGQTREK
jgi:hypothetical protein